MRYYAVTIKNDEAFAIETANRINKSYPGSAKVENGQCLITEDHYKYCKNYVLTNCKIKDKNKPQ